MSRALVSISPDIPWHVTAFYPTYKHLDSENTSAEILQTAADIGQEAGLRYVYAGNLPGRVGPLENTTCPKCRQLLVRRNGYIVRENRITNEALCPNCGEIIPGIWH
jgi:pyruvate formate lyase activating enzyme